MFDTFANSWIVADQVPQFKGFPRQEYWGEFLFPSPGDLPNPGIKSVSLDSPASACRFFTTVPAGKLGGFKRQSNN